ncbi:MAG TPA: M1 family metallopeptidase [Chryseosolibacter sp.]
MKYLLTLFAALLAIQFSNAQDYRWQQRADYTMDIKFDVTTHRFTGTQKLIYTNNSPDTLRKVYYHLYYNAFQPGSMMDVRSRTIADPDPRVQDRISKLKPEEIGYQHIQSLKQDGKDVSHSVNGTILEVVLAKPILPNGKATFDMKFESQVPLQIRRTGRNNREGIDYSMTQWFPKMAEYDYRGWHAYQYVAREFHGVWGDYDVKITIDPSYVLAGTGKLQNPEAIGYGYEKAGTTVKRPDGNLTWHFIAKRVHDFAWAADRDYAHDKVQMPDGPELHFFYQPKEKFAQNWKNLQPVAIEHFKFMNTRFGKYPYDTYSIIQGGDGGMEYAMCTLILGEGTFNGLVEVMAHEVTHAWYQGVLASNESLYAWMDEGFTDFASNEFLGIAFEDPKPQASSYAGYFALIRSGLQEPPNQHSDHFNTNRGYSTTAYNVGTIFCEQLKYIIGEETFYKGMRAYFNKWQFRHPEPNDFIRVMEKTSGMQLTWYLNYLINTTKRINYSIKSVVSDGSDSFITLERLGEFPMPIDLLVTYKDGSKEIFYVPLNETLGNKPVENKSIQRKDLVAWPWVNPTYTLKVSRPTSDIATVEIDPTERMADIDRKNNKVNMKEGLSAYQDPTK